MHRDETWAGAPLHSSTNGKTGIHVNGLRGLCRPLPPRSFSLSFSLACFFFLLLQPRCVSFSPSLYNSLSFSLCTHRVYFFILSLSLYRSSLYLFLSVASFFHFQIRISVIRTASLDKTLFIDASPRSGFLLSSFPCCSSVTGCASVSVRLAKCGRAYMCVHSQLNALSSEISTVPRASFHENFVPRDQR